MGWYIIYSSKLINLYTCWSIFRLFRLDTSYVFARSHHKCNWGDGGEVDEGIKN